MTDFDAIGLHDYLRCARCGRVLKTKEGLRRWPMSPVHYWFEFVCMDCEFALQLENGMYNK